MKISFDFDSTLSRKDVQEYASELSKKGFEIWIITSRYSDEYISNNNIRHLMGQNDILFEVAEKCGIKFNNIIFTNMEDKIDHIEGNDFLFHLDDDIVEIDFINIESDDKCLGILLDENWLENCNNIIK